MSYESDILAEENNIKDLQSQLKGIKIPCKTINFQFQNMRYGNQLVKRNELIQRRTRLQLQGQIKKSQSKINYLKSQLQF